MARIGQENFRRPTGERREQEGGVREVLAGVRVVELAQYVFVPVATGVLSEGGADVVKVEPPQGDA